MSRSGQETIWGATLEKPEGVLRQHGNIVAHDRDWQFPAITEQHAYHQLRDLGGVPDGVVYVAYPWATLIDKIQAGARDAHVHLKRFRDYCLRLPPGRTRVTVCQHIMLRRYMHLFEGAGISHVFWTHATHADVRTAPEGTIAIHPFPLYPVQVTTETDVEATAERPFLFSFVGARSNRHYLTNVRELIIDLLGGHPGGLVISRDTWHYNRVVYEHQIHEIYPAGDGMVDHSASDQFRVSLSQSLFSLCPSGSGPNSIRLWESLGAGSIPVILADTFAPPGNPALWEQAAVFCAETEEAIKALPARLEAIAADPLRIAAMRHAMRQLWLLYGPHAFVHDVQALMLRLAGQAGDDRPAPDRIPLSLRAARSLYADAPMPPPYAERLLRECSGTLLLEGAACLRTLDEDTAHGRLVRVARDSVGADHPVARHYRQVFDHVAERAGQSPAAPAVTHGSAPRICLVGRHSNRTPLAYAPFRQTAGARISVVTDPMEADIVMTGFNLDIMENFELFRGITTSRPDTKVVVLSEEPLWDSIWSGGFAERARTARSHSAGVPYTFLNHENSAIFDFEAIPYFLLTSEEYLTRYGLLIARHMALKPSDLLERWRRAPVPAAFYAEVRDAEAYSQVFEAHGLHGLSVYRTEIARKVDLPGTLRAGKGWQSDARRQDLPDWHLDKIAALDNRVRITAAYENTHQKNYVSEKIFDAFVVGGIPAYYADRGHRVLSLVPDSSMINTWGMNAQDAAQRLAAFEADMDLAESWLDTAAHLQKTFSDASLIVRERHRVVDAILSELQALRG